MSTTHLNPQDYLNKIVYYAPTVTRIQEATITEVKGYYYIDARPQIFFTIVTSTGEEYNLIQAHPNPQIFFTIEEAKKSIEDNLKYREEQAKLSYERELEKIKEYRESLQVT